MNVQTGTGEVGPADARMTFYLEISRFILASLFCYNELKFLICQ